MANQNIYSIQLLNDLHNHFPEILYNPRRFETVQDLLSYIRGVSEVSPYERGLHQYRMRQTNTSRARHVPNTAYRNPIISMLIPNLSSLDPDIPPTTSVPNPLVPNPLVPSTSRDNIPPSTTRSTANTRTTTDSISSRMQSSNAMDNIIGGLSTLLGSENGGIMIINNQSIEERMQSFLEQTVPVFPTSREIQNASTTFIPDESRYDNCAICQDEIAVNQSVRRLTFCEHYFHQICIDTWFQRNVHCPSCRHDIRILNDSASANSYRRPNAN